MFLFVIAGPTAACRGSTRGAGGTANLSTLAASAAIGVGAGVGDAGTARRAAKRSANAGNAGVDMGTGGGEDGMPAVKGGGAATSGFEGDDNTAHAGDAGKGVNGAGTKTPTPGLRNTAGEVGAASQPPSAPGDPRKGVGWGTSPQTRRKGDDDRADGVSAAVATADGACASNGLSRPCVGEAAPTRSGVGGIGA